MASRTLKLCFFGAFALEVNGKGVPPPRWRKSQWLLALLALRQGRDVSRTWLAETLWPDAEPSSALFNLRQTLAQDLRPSLGSASGLVSSPSSSTLCLDALEVWSDVAAFDSAISTSPAEAVALYKGPFLEGCAEEWAQQERVTREEAYYAALETLAAEAVSRQEFAEAAGLLRRCLAGAPLRENAHIALMEALSASGDQAGVTQAYRDLRTVLRRELNSEPDDQTRVLYERLRKEAHLHVLPPLSPAVSIPRRLPVPLTRLIGRENEIQEVLDRFARGRMVTLVGIGGVGKTRLSIAVAEEMVKDCHDGVWLVELASLENSDLVGAAIAKTLQTRDQPGKTIEETLVEALASRSLLIVLDNCEHLPEACARVSEHLLTRCSGLRMLATSRQPLGINGEWIYRVPSLEYPRLESPQTQPDTNKNAAYEMLDYDALRLFVERAAAQKDRFKPTADQVLAIAEICEVLDGIPLAIEMAAARVRTLSVEEVRLRLADRFQLLRSGTRTAMPRHQTLRALIDWSYDLLNHREKLLLAQLSVFAGGWTLEAAENISSDEVVDPLTSLADKSLVVFEDVAARYRLLESMREYARECLVETGQSEAVRERHLAWYLALAEAAAKNLQGPDQQTWLDRLDPEYDNLRAALSHALVTKGKSEAALRLCSALQIYWYLRGFLAEGRAWVARALEAPEALKRTAVRAMALNGSGVMARMQGDHTVARSCHDESLSIYREIGDLPGVAKQLMNLGYIDRYEGNYSSALTYFEQCLAICREIGERRGIAAALGNVGAVAYFRGDYNAARTAFEENIAIERELGDSHGIAGSLLYIGSVDAQIGNYASAQSQYEQALEISREIGDQAGAAVALFNLGDVFVARCNYVSARALYEQSLGIQQKIGRRRGVALVYCGLGTVDYCQGKYASARKYHEESLAIQKEIRDRAGVAHSMYCIANVACGLGDYVRSRTYHEESLAMQRDIGDKRGIANSLYGLGSLSNAQGDTDAARLHFEESLGIRRKIGDRPGTAYTLNGLGAVALEKGDHASATGYLDESVRISSDLDDRLCLLASLELCARLACAKAAGSPCINGDEVRSANVLSEYRRAARLLGAASAIRTEIGAPASPADSAKLEMDAAAARKVLGESEWESARDQGRAITVEQAIEFAIGAST